MCKYGQFEYVSNVQFPVIWMSGQHVVFPEIGMKISKPFRNAFHLNILGMFRIKEPTAVTVRLIATIAAIICLVASLGRMDALPIIALVTRTFPTT